MGRKAHDRIFDVELAQIAELIAALPLATDRGLAALEAVEVPRAPLQWTRIVCHNTLAAEGK